jgi:hypothetical protein
VIRKFKIFEQIDSNIDPYGEEDWNEFPFDDYIDFIKNIRGVKNFTYMDADPDYPKIGRTIEFKFKGFNFDFYELHGQNTLQLSHERGNETKTETTNITSKENFILQLDELINKMKKRIENKIDENKRYKRGKNKIDPYGEENWGDEHKLPGSVKGVKCMIVGCQNMASHKVGEENPWNPHFEEEQYREFEMRHNLTTYLCSEHFDWLMHREEIYFREDNRF